jgi:putative tryptophan/tyrosine transport system substrate-binding protein
MKNVGISLLFFALPLLAYSQNVVAQKKNVVARAQHAKVYHVVVMVAGKLDFIPPQIRGLRSQLEGFGYIEGKNLAYDLLQEETYDALRASLKASIQQTVDVIVTLSEAETAIAREVTDKIPIVFMPVGDPVRARFIRSLASPGTNLTGLTYMEPTALAKQLEVFKEVAPSLRQVLVLFERREENPITAPTLALVREVAEYMNIRLIEKPITSLAEGEHAVSLLPKNPMNGVFHICAGFFRRLKTIAAVGVERRLPIFGCSARQVADEGVLLTYAPDLFYIGYRGAWYADRILKGARPQDLPVETPKKFELVINLKTANAIGIKIPPEVLQRADKVIREAPG